MATRVTISKALEARLRKDDYGLVQEIVELLDAEQKKAERKRAADSEEPKSGYKELVALFRSFLGSELLTPPKPNTVFIVKLLNKAREIGIDYDVAKQISAGAIRTSRGPYRIGDLVWNGDTYYARGGKAEEEGAEPILFTGRGEFLTSEDGG